MYTQCPECDVAFRVTATVLRQAAGKVRCGGCGVAFNALDHLSEDMPEVAPQTEADAEQADSAADPDSEPELKAANPPDAISAEHSAALLKTLDQLEGGDVRIEDTGIEWRVLDDDDEDPDVVDGEESGSATGSMSFVLQDEANDDDPTGIATHDQPDDIESSEAREQMRFDDDTPLPEDYEILDNLPTGTEALETVSEPTPPAEETQVDVALGEPGEWEDLLDEVVADSPHDMDRQFARQAEAMGIDLSGVNAVADDADDEAVTEAVAEIVADDVEIESSIDDDLIAAAFETEAATRNQRLDDDREIDEFEAAAVEIEAAAGTLEDDQDTDFELPEQTEEELTINRMIDQDLLALAVEDNDGFTSTIVQQIDDYDEKAEESATDNPLIETIIMEGDFVRSALESGAPAVNLEELTFVEQAKETINKAIHGGRRATGPPGYNMIISAVALSVLLVAQLVHQSRHALATAPLFENSIAPIYRLIGKPVMPAWNIGAWRFEATKGNTDQDEQLLTIYSRVGNTSDEALPYPLVYVSLTDRFEETIGSRILEPGEYLVGDVDPGAPVAAGATFHAVISIDSPAPEATGFKLNVCYRLQVGELRCAIEDFK